MQIISDPVPNRESSREGQDLSIEKDPPPHGEDVVGMQSPLAFDASMHFLEDLDMGETSFDFMFQMPESPVSQLPAATTSPATLNGVLDSPGPVNPQLLGLTSDMDPFLLQHYRTDERGMSHFKQLAIQPVQSDPFPAQFLFSQPSIFTKRKEEAGVTNIADSELRQQLEQIVSPEAGRRLISLYDKFVAPQCPVFSAQCRPDPLSSPSHLLAAAYAVAFPFSIHDDQLCIDLAYDAPPYAALSRIINAALPADLHSPSLATVQTLLLMLHVGKTLFSESNSFNDLYERSLGSSHGAQ
ncbi:unnamed protein product [Clonostachys rosea]|uniref:Transcription factor domain-containing protein n=1 Tax=Bionectria ochroleuca TaxID=29856 RepID=A0ABY6UEK1_BIOOC|nr:unnamed protein product [Clonostachys rosea]